jgi:hypothetical protein
MRFGRVASDHGSDMYGRTSLERDPGTMSACTGACTINRRPLRVHGGGYGGGY